MLDGRVAQLVERWPYKPDVVGSSPVPPTIDILCGAVVQSGLTRWPVKPEIAGSIPVSPAIFLSILHDIPTFALIMDNTQQFMFWLQQYIQDMR